VYHIIRTRPSPTGGPLYVLLQCVLQCMLQCMWQCVLSTGHPVYGCAFFLLTGEVSSCLCVCAGVFGWVCLRVQVCVCIRLCIRVAVCRSVL